MGYVYRGNQPFTRKGSHGEKKLKPCGTYGAWCRHKYRDEEIDAACHNAKLEYDAARRNAKKRAKSAG